MSFMSTISSDTPTSLLPTSLLVNRWKIASGAEGEKEKEQPLPDNLADTRLPSSFLAILARQISQKAREELSPRRDAPTSMQYNLETRITEIKIMRLEYFSAGNLHKKTVTRAERNSGRRSGHKIGPDFMFFGGWEEGANICVLVARA